MAFWCVPRYCCCYMKLWSTHIHNLVIVVNSCLSWVIFFFVLFNRACTYTKRQLCYSWSPIPFYTVCAYFFNVCDDFMYVRRLHIFIHDVVCEPRTRLKVHRSDRENNLNSTKKKLIKKTRRKKNDKQTTMSATSKWFEIFPSNWAFDRWSLNDHFWNIKPKMFGKNSLASKKIAMNFYFIRETREKKSEEYKEEMMSPNVPIRILNQKRWGNSQINALI